jgi:hypothetical protein
MTGTDDQAQTLCLWLTQRLINRLVPHLCEGLEKQTSASATKGREQPLRAHVGQSFAQQRTRAALRRQAPVVASGDAAQWLDVDGNPSDIAAHTLQTILFRRS